MKRMTQALVQAGAFLRVVPRDVRHLAQHNEPIVIHWGTTLTSASDKPMNPERVAC